MANPGSDLERRAANPRPWYAVWTHSHCERLVRDRLAGLGFETYLPEARIWSVRAGRRHEIRVPLFPGYLFLACAMTPRRYVEVAGTRGVAKILGGRWDRLATVPEREVAAIRTTLEAGLSPGPHPYLREGKRVRIRRGPLAGVEGILLELRPDKGLLVLSIELFQRSVAVEVDCALAAAA